MPSREIPSLAFIGNSVLHPDTDVHEDEILKKENAERLCKDRERRRAKKMGMSS
jgi:hypothetical protein